MPLGFECTGWMDHNGKHGCRGPGEHHASKRAELSALVDSDSRLTVSSNAACPAS